MATADTLRVSFLSESTDVHYGYQHDTPFFNSNNRRL